MVADLVRHLLDRRGEVIKRLRIQTAEDEDEDENEKENESWSRRVYSQVNLTLYGEALH